MKYNTKQKQSIIDYLKANMEKCLTVFDIKNYFDEKNIEIGQTTIYRCLDELEKNNKIIKYTNDISASYQYVEDDCHLHFHLKCTVCLKLIHLDCLELNNLESHIKQEHKFKIDNSKTVIYGICPKCLEKVSL